MLIELLFTNPIAFVLIFMALAMAITVHEFAHALAADKLGDPTPRLQGRVTLNPLKHLDPFGTLLMLLLNFGWGRPVQFDPYNLKNIRRDSAIISFAGPLSNLLLASIFSIILRIVPIDGAAGGLLNLIGPLFIRLNVTLAVFNLLPIHPLDGGKILVGLLPPREARSVDRFLHQYGLILLFILIFPVLGGVSFVSSVLTPIIDSLMMLYLPGRQFI